MADDVPMPDDPRRIFLGGALLVMSGIVLGAFAAHGLRARLDLRALGWWATAVDYQMWNALGLLVLGLVPARAGLPASLIGLGVLIFSGSLYAMALTDLRALGMVTPIGGLLMIAGWGLAAWRIARR
jgi:uncharacterized membrane protein YgdD (TMEM256/DUF423 family)